MNKEEPFFPSERGNAMSRFAAIRAYKDAFKAAGIEIIWQNFKCPEYPQQYAPFVPDMSAIDAIANNFIPFK